LHVFTARCSWAKSLVEQCAALTRIVHAQPRSADLILYNESLLCISCVIQYHPSSFCSVPRDLPPPAACDLDFTHYRWLLTQQQQQQQLSVSSGQLVSEYTCSPSLSPSGRRQQTTTKSLFNYNGNIHPVRRRGGSVNENCADMQQMTSQEAASDGGECMTLS